MNAVNDIVLLDGGMGQELYRRGVKKVDLLWSTNALISNPDIVRDVHIEFTNAGARVMTTNTYCTNPHRLRRAGIENRFDELNDLACKLAYEAREQVGIEGVRIAGALPPLYGSYRPDIERDMEEMLAEYRLMAQRLAPQVDILLCETMTTIDEAIAAATACHETKVPTWLAFTVADDETGAMRSGESLQDAVQKLNDFNIEAFLINCCAPESVVPALKQLKTVTDLPVGAYANGFRQIPEKWQSGKIEQLGTREELTPTVYTEFVKTWIDEGASIVGGCCEISPAHIQEISKMLEA